MQPQQIRIEELNKIIKPGYRIFLGTGCSEPIIISSELVQKKYRWFDCQIIHFLTLSSFKYFSDENPSHFRHNTLSMIGSKPMRDAVNSGKSDFVPIKSSEIPRMLKSGEIPIDIAFLQVSPPDEYGYCSLGINVDINYTVAKIAKIVVAQVNAHMPYTRGNSVIKFSDVDYIIRHDLPLMEYSWEIPKDVDQIHLYDKIGEFVSRLIEDGTTLNVGLGKIPPYMWTFLSHKKNLAIYSEVLVLTDTLLKMVKEGVINCEKNGYPHIMTSFVLGKLHHYDYLHRNPMFEFQPTEFLNNVMNIAKNNKMCSIYSAIAVDLTGQITNHLPHKFYSGIGGEHDFIQGTSMSNHGKTIIVLPSTAQKDQISRIVPVVSRSSIPASDVHYVVTEWGIARLGGKNIRERTLQLIAISHPKYRAYLLKQAKEMHLIYEDQILPTQKDGRIILYPENLEWEYETTDHSIIHFRPVKPTDEGLLQQFFYHLDEKDRVMRFLAPKKIFPHEQTQQEVNIDYVNTFAVVGLYGDEDKEEPLEIVCAGSYYLDTTGNTNWAEIATVIAGQWQRKGLGTHIFEKLIEIALEYGISGFFGEIAPYNKGILSILNKLPYNVQLTTQADSIEFEIAFEDTKNGIPNNFFY